MITFEWDDAKAAANLKKYRVSFDEAKSIFSTSWLFSFSMTCIQLMKNVFLMLGISSGARMLIVCHCERNHGGVIRIISARKATKRESAFYRGGYT
jgi:uncharacterized protein